MFSYKPLWKQLIDKNMTRTEMREKANISMPTLATMGKDEYVAMSILDKICNTLDCTIDEVIEHVKDEEKGE